MAITSLATGGAVAAAVLPTAQRMEAYDWSEKEKSCLIGLAKASPDALGQPTSTKQFIQKRYDAYVKALWAVKHGKEQHDPSLQPPTAEEKARLKKAIYNWWKNSNKGGGVMYRGMHRKFNERGEERPASEQKKMQAGGRNKRKRSMMEPKALSMEAAKTPGGVAAAAPATAAAPAAAAERA